MSGRAKLEGVHWLLLSETARNLLAERLKVLLPRGASLGPCRLSEVRFKPGRKLTAYYDTAVSTDGGETHHVRPIAVTWGSDTDADQVSEECEITKARADAVCRGVAAPFLQLLANFPEWNMQIRVSPLDPRFTQLARLSDPRHVSAMLAKVLAAGNAQSGHPGISNYTVTSVKYRPGKRHVLRYDPVDPNKGETVFAKLYIGRGEARSFRREDGARAVRVAREVSDWLAERGNGLNCLSPLAYIAEDAVVLYPRVGGVPLSDLARRHSRATARWLREAGIALRTLHRLPVTLAGRPEPHDLAAEVQLIARKGDHIPLLLPQVGLAIEAILDGALELHERLPQEPPTFTHGDLKTEHLWLGADWLTVMDLDSSRLGDPALDVGYFLADWQFRHTASDHAGVDVMLKSFLAGHAPGTPKERLIRARLYEAVELVKCAVRRVPLFEDDWASRVSGIVSRAEAVINDLQRTLGLRGGPLRHTCRLGSGLAVNRSKRR